MIFYFFTFHTSTLRLQGKCHTAFRLHWSEGKGASMDVVGVSSQSEQKSIVRTATDCTCDILKWTLGLASQILVGGISMPGQPKRCNIL